MGGAFEMIGSGVGEYFTGGTLSPLAVPVFINGFDNFQTGFQQVVTGEEMETVLQQGVENLSTAMGADKGTSMAITAAVDLVSGNLKSLPKTGKTISNANALLRSGNSFSIASKYGIGSLKDKIGKGSGLQVHHLIEK